jgi:tRNA G18 (ribose-2'-O)-methylase SpoU
VKQLSLEALNRIDLESFQSAEKMPVVVILDNIRSLHNIGSVFRTADAFRIASVYLCGITACPPHREIHKTALGATESVEWKYFKSSKQAITHLKTNGYKIIAVEQTDQSKQLSDIAVNDIKTALIFGNEVAGVSEEVLQLCDAAIEIPQSGTKHSLNVSVCAGIVLWHYYSKWNNFSNLSGKSS